MQKYGMKCIAEGDELRKNIKEFSEKNVSRAAVIIAHER